jgi:CO/xanthine dehydrogenase Mo-binding subunit
MERAFALTDYRGKRERFARENVGRAVKKGIGFAAFMHGSGFTGSGERYLKSLAGVEATADGKVRVLAASTEIGQGANTIFAQIAAETLGLTLDDVEVAQPDTAHVPNSGPTVASRTTMVVGNLIARACRGLALTLVQGGALAAEHTPDELRRAFADYVRAQGSLRVLAEYEEPKGIHWDDKAYRGDAYGTYAWAVYVAEVSVDSVTYQTRVDDFVAVQEVGKVIHPVLAAGQIEGGVAQGIGWALYEDVVWREGRMHNGQMTNYIMPTAADVPPIRVFFAEEPYAHGPYGAKGIGELPMDGPAPAALNAVEHAVGLPADQVPLLPEALLRLMRGAA